MMTKKVCRGHALIITFGITMLVGIMFAGTVNAVGELPDLVVTSVSGPTSSNTEQTITVSSTFKNQDLGIAGDSVPGFYLSADSTITTSDIYLGAPNWIGGLAPGEARTASFYLKIPSSVASGTYYIGVIADSWSSVTESNEENNALAGNQIVVTNPGQDTTPPTITDLKPIPGSLTNNNMPEISAVVVDTGSGINTGSIVLKLDGQVLAHTFMPIETRADGTAVRGKVLYQPSQPLVDGTHNIELTVSDKASNIASVAPQQVIVDTQPPQIIGSDVSVSTPGASSGTVSVSGCTSLSFSFTGEQAVISQPLPDGTCTVTVTAVDSAGNTATATWTFIVDTTPPAITIDTPAPYGVYPAGTALDFSASDLLSGVASVSGNLTNTTGAYIEVTSGFTPTPGVYTLAVGATDRAGNTATSGPIFFVVYDPDGGFVTGGGWIDSPAGAYMADTTLTGHANFGFVSQYKKGATIPTGVTEFQFNVASLNFHSDAYEWLVVAGARAQYKGTGMINGIGSYGFMLTAIDGAINGGGGNDKFRIKIWDKNNGDAIVYDNQLGAEDSAEPTTVVQGGSIVIHADNNG